MITLNNEDYLSVKETIEKLSISKMTLWRWIKEEKLKKYSLSARKIYFKKNEVEGIIK